MLARVPGLPRLGILTWQVLGLDRKIGLGISRTAAAATVPVLVLVISASMGPIIGAEGTIVAVAAWSS